MKPTDVQKFLEELNAGVFEEQIGAALSRVAAGVADHGRKGQVRITFDISRLNDGHQVMVSHKLDYNQPNLRGNTKIDTTTQTPMYVTPDGLSLFDRSTEQIFTPEEAPVKAVPITSGKKSYN